MPVSPEAEASRKSSDDEEYDDLPELLIGTTELQPVMVPVQSNTSTESLDKMGPSSDKLDEVEVVEVEYAGGRLKR